VVRNRRCLVVHLSETAAELEKNRPLAPRRWWGWVVNARQQVGPGPQRNRLRPWAADVGPPAVPSRGAKTLGWDGGPVVGEGSSLPEDELARAQ